MLPIILDNLLPIYSGQYGCDEVTAKPCIVVSLYDEPTHLLKLFSLLSIFVVVQDLLQLTIALPYGIHAVARADENTTPGVIFVLKNVNHGVNIDKQNRLHPFYLVCIADDGSVTVNHLQSKELLTKLRHLSKGNDQPDGDMVAKFNAETSNGKDMDKYSRLLGYAIESMISTKTEKDVDSLFSDGGTTALESEITGLDQFELISFLVVR